MGETKTMARDEDIAKLTQQETELVFDHFNEVTAFEIGSRIRDRAIRDGFAIVCEIKLWDRPLFYFALPGTTADNPEWARRKAFLVKRFQKSSYRLMFENKEERLYAPNRGLDVNDYALSGGGFPIRLKGIGVTGSITVSGVPERMDHTIVVDAICDQLGLVKQDYALAAQ
jgi:uncharacterized protein (UPF0303 family)